MLKMTGNLNIWSIQPRNYVNGPGCRFVIWVQGCHLSCPECWNKHTWSFQEKNIVDVEQLFLQIAGTKGISGVTFSGGEPFVQAKGLYELARRVKNELALNIQIFTGYEIHELKGKYQKMLFDLADILVYGRFDPSKANNNQKVHSKGNCEWNFNNTDVEVDFDDKGNMVITGYPPDELINEIQESMR